MATEGRAAGARLVARRGATEGPRVGGARGGCRVGKSGRAVKGRPEAGVEGQGRAGRRVAVRALDGHVPRGTPWQVPPPLERGPTYPTARPAYPIAWSDLPWSAV